MANEKPLNVTHEAFISTCRFLMNRITEALVKAETARLLMIQRGLCSESDFEAMESYVQNHWDSMVSKAVAEAQARASDAELHRLLESLQLPKQ